MSSSRRKHRNSAVFRDSCGIPGTPIFQYWKLHKKKHLGNTSPVNFSNGFPKSTDLSARKLAAELWQLQFLRDVSFHSSKSETGDQLRKPITILRSREGIQCELESFSPCPKCSREEVAKGEPALSGASNEFTKVLSRKLLEEGKSVVDSVVSALLAELLRAKRCINNLKASQRSSKKKVEHIVQKLEEQKLIWRRRERRKIQSMFVDLKDKLSRERRSRERTELLNTKLAHELAEANLYGKQFMTNYKEEKKRREVIEEVCNELAMQIEEDKAKLEALLWDSMKIREELEEERNMLKMSELWREERVQMKLVDAKLELQEKYNQIIQLIAYLQTFLRSSGAELGTKEENSQFQLIEQAAESANIQGVLELLYDVKKSNNVFSSLYEDLRRDNANERVLTGPSSTIQIWSLDEEELNKNSELHESIPSGDYNTSSEVSSESSETVSLVEDQKFSSTSQWRDIYLGDFDHDRNMLGSEAECSQKTEPKWKASSASKLLRSWPSDGKTSSAAKTCQHKKAGGKGSSDEGGFRHWELLGQGNSRDSMNPHITRGMKGCIEWPRGIPRTNSKVIPLEERVRSQKSQLKALFDRGTLHRNRVE